jgi:hypothetical protein
MHLVLTLCTCGLWAISWIAASVGHILRPWRCKHCGWHKPEFRTNNQPIVTRKPF